MDKKLKTFELRSPEEKRRCLDWLTQLKPSEHEGRIIVTAYEHVVTVPRDVQAAYMAKLGDFCKRYLKTIEKVSSHTGYTMGELCQELHRSSDGFYWADIPRTDDFHEKAKAKFNNGETTTGMEAKEFKQFRELAYRYSEGICDGLDRWAAEYFNVQ